MQQRQNFASRRQQGAALVMALAVLVLLTILGISAMKSSTLEYRMATSIQDKSVAFQAAESALVKAMGSVSLNPNQAQQVTYAGKTDGIGKSNLVTATVTTSYQGSSSSNSNRSEKPDGTGTRWYNFKQISTANITDNGATTTIETGFKQRANAN